MSGIQDDNRVGGRGRVRNGKGYYRMSRCERECIYVRRDCYIYCLCVMIWGERWRLM